MISHTILYYNNRRKTNYTYMINNKCHKSNKYNKCFKNNKNHTCTEYMTFNTSDTSVTYVS